MQLKMMTSKLNQFYLPIITYNQDRKVLRFLQKVHLRKKKLSLIRDGRDVKKKITKVVPSVLQVLRMQEFHQMLRYNVSVSKAG